MRQDLDPGLDTLGDLLGQFRQGDRAAAGKLVEVFFPELRRMAASRMRRERLEHTWQPTALVNELYLELLKIRGLCGSEGGLDKDRALFFGLAGHLMKRLLIHHARPLSRRVQRAELDEAAAVANPDDELADVERMLVGLHEIDPKLRIVVELKVFEQCSIDEAAERMECSRRSINRYWQFACKWLAQNLASTDARGASQK
jgi:RNA polymerase sigma factor (TIGR02999 family)